MKGNMKDKEQMTGWEFTSPVEEGYHTVIMPGRDDCRAVYIFRLNLNRGNGYTLESGELELNPVLICGKAKLASEIGLSGEVTRFDSFYIPAKARVTIQAVTDVVFYVGGAVYEGIGIPSFRKYDATLPIGDMHQIHGKGAARREVMFTLPPQQPASRLICGLTWGEDGAWTSWPPHQHERDLEEVYCYFDMDAPKWGFHLSYLESGGIVENVAHVVRTGSMVLAPRGYHPTVASPGTANAYYWVMTAFTSAGRRYDLAVPDPVFAGT